MGDDTWMRVAARALFGPIVAGLPSIGAVSFLSYAVGIAAAVCFATGDPTIRYVGAGLYLVAMLVERAGPVHISEADERRMLRTTAMVQVLTFAGIGFGLRYGALGTEAIAMGLVAGFAISAALMLARRLERGKDGRRVALNGLDTSDLLIAVPVFVWLGSVETMLAIAAFAAPALTLGLLVAFLIRQRKKS